MTQAAVIRQSRSSLALTQTPSAYCEDSGCWQRSLCIIHTSPPVALQREAQAHHSRKPQNTYCEDNNCWQKSPCIIHAVAPERILPPSLISIIIAYLMISGTDECNILEAMRRQKPFDFQNRARTCFLTMTQAAEYHVLSEGGVPSQRLPAFPQGELDPGPFLMEVRDEPEICPIIAKELRCILEYIFGQRGSVQDKQTLSIMSGVLTPISKLDKARQQSFICAFTAQEPPISKLYMQLTSTLIDMVNNHNYDAALIFLDILENISRTSENIPLLNDIKNIIECLCNYAKEEMNDAITAKSNIIEAILKQKLNTNKSNLFMRLFFQT